MLTIFTISSGQLKNPCCCYYLFSAPNQFLCLPDTVLLSFKKKKEKKKKRSRDDAIRFDQSCVGCFISHNTNWLGEHISVKKHPMQECTCSHRCCPPEIRGHPTSPYPLETCRKGKGLSKPSFPTLTHDSLADPLGRFRQTLESHICLHTLVLIMHSLPSAAGGSKKSLWPLLLCCPASAILQNVSLAEVWDQFQIILAKETK